MSLEGEVNTCKSCGAKIVWHMTKDQKPMPCDAEPTELLLPAGSVVQGILLIEAQPIAGYKSHFATCPDRKKWRKT